VLNYRAGRYYKIKVLVLSVLLCYIWTWYSASIFVSLCNLPPHNLSILSLYSLWCWRGQAHTEFCENLLCFHVIALDERCLQPRNFYLFNLLLHFLIWHGVLVLSVLFHSSVSWGYSMKLNFFQHCTHNFNNIFLALVSHKS
jgi:hypothetical protein